MVVVKILAENPQQMSFAEHDDVVKALTPDRADDPLGIRVLPGATRGNDHLLDSQRADALLEHLPVDGVPVTEQIARGPAKGERFDDLLGGPRRCGMSRHVEVDDPPTLVTEHDEAEQHAEADRRHGEEVDGGDVADMVLEKGPPSLRRWFPVSDHVLGHRPLGEIDAQQSQLRSDPGSPHKGFAMDIPRMSSLTSVASFGRPTLRRVDFPRQ